MHLNPVGSRQEDIVRAHKCDGRAVADPFVKHELVFPEVRLAASHNTIERISMTEEIENKWRFWRVIDFDWRVPTCSMMPRFMMATRSARSSASS